MYRKRQGRRHVFLLVQRVAECFMTIIEPDCLKSLSPILYFLRPTSPAPPRLPHVESSASLTRSEEDGGHCDRSDSSVWLNYCPIVSTGILHRTQYCRHVTGTAQQTNFLCTIVVKNSVKRRTLASTRCGKRPKCSISKSQVARKR